MILNQPKRPTASADILPETLTSPPFSMKRTQPVSLLLICKYDLFFRIIESTLYETGFTLSCVCKVPAQSGFYYNRVQPDLVLIDSGWNNSHFSAQEVLASLLGIDRDCKIIFVSTFFDRRTRENAERLGAKGYLHTDASSFQLISNCLKDVFEGSTHFMNDPGPGITG